MLLSLITILRIVSSLLGIIGITFIVPIICALCCKEYSVIFSFLIPMLASFVFFGAINIPFRKKKISFNKKTTFAVVALAWVSACFFGSIPLYFSGFYPSFTDAFFESVSGFSTTGATVLSDVEILPRSLNLWRCMMLWLGGMGIVALTVALLPLLGVGGFQLIKAETTGPEKGKLTPKITTTAKYLWVIYLVLTATETLLLWAFGMDFIDALSHAFSTLGTGGFSTRNGGVASYNSVGIDIVITVFMFLGGVNFTLYYYALNKRFSDIRHNSEFKAYIILVVVSVLVLSATICKQSGSFAHALRLSSFQAISVMTTTGFTTCDYTTWSSAAQIIIFMLFFTGACSGSTSGGIKLIRWLVLGKQVRNEVKVLLHPQGIFNIRLNGTTVRKEVVPSVTAFMILYFLLIFINMILGCICDLDLLTAFTASASMVGNIGLAFGELGPTCNYGFIPGFLKWFYAFEMLAGRLELYTMVIFFMPEYWQNR